ncbi:MAG: hypothetical protein LAQ69_34285 [Acidobacteriia bacterium]|nr:hypothetical protein [Terriglobia bacterium]
MRTSTLSAILLASAAALASAQPPVQVRIQGDVTIHQDFQSNLQRTFMETNRQMIESAYRARQLQIQQGYLDLARQEAEEALRAREQSAALENRVLDDELGYKEFRRASASWKVNQDVMDAFAAGRLAHPDFDALLPAMRIIADSLRPQWSKVTMAEYVECLYVIAKNASFAAPVRTVLLNPEPAPKQ